MGPVRIGGVQKALHRGTAQGATSEGLGRHLRYHQAPLAAMMWVS
jgi:hypothetical protein